jgi:hypothetical protein
MTTEDQDDDLQLRDQLRALDPAASLPPADPAWVARLLEDTMSDDLDTHLPETRATGVHERSRLTWLVAAAAVLLIAGVSTFALLQRGTDDDVPAAGPSGEPADPATVTSLSAPADASSAKCAVPTADIMGQQDLAFDGVVDDISAGMVTLTPTMFYAGEPTDIVRVEAPPEALEGLLLAVQFEVGQRYLVSAAGGQVSVCGYSGAWSPGLEQLFVEAFPG